MAQSKFHESSQLWNGGSSSWCKPLPEDKSHTIPWKTINFLWFPMVFPWFSPFSHGFPLVFLWFSLGFPLVFLWFSPPSWQRSTFETSQGSRRQQSAQSLCPEAENQWPGQETLSGLEAMASWNMRDFPIENGDFPINNGEFSTEIVSFPIINVDFP